MRMEERRRFVRFNARLKASYRVFPQTQPIQTVTKDLGGGGVCFFAEAPLAPGTRLQAELTLPDREQPIPFTAEVICSEAHEVLGKGTHERAVEVDVRFVEISPNDQADIMQHIMMSLRAPNVI